MAAVLAGCMAYGIDLSLLPSPSGWRKLPLRSWVMNDDLGPATVDYCLDCKEPAIVATLVAHGEEADALMRSLATPRALLQAKRYEVAKARDPRKARPRRVARASSERAEPIVADGLRGYRVTLSGHGGHDAYAVVLAKRDADTAKAALAVATDPGSALAEARQAARGF
jgi:hypothetical protein